MEKVFILYVAYGNLSEDSKRIISVCSTIENALRIAKKDANENDEPDFSNEEIEMLETKYQTQGRDENYIIEPFTLDSYFN